MSADTTELERLERWFSAAISHPEGARQGIRSERAAQLLPEAVSDLESIVLPSRSLNAMDRLSIYANMYFDRLVDVLADEFPTVRHIIGSPVFAKVARSYVSKYPSQHYSLAQLGSRFPMFLGEFSQGDPLSHQAFAVAVATVERCMEDVFDAEQAVPVTLEQLENIAPDRLGQLRFRMIPASRLLTLAYPVNDFITSVRHEKAIDVPAAGTAHVVVYRKDYKVWRVDLNAHQHAILDALHAGQTLEDALEVCAELPGFDSTMLATAVQEWFRNWMVEGLFCGSAFRLQS
jgi:hypothetical protein